MEGEWVEGMNSQFNTFISLSFSCRIILDADPASVVKRVDLRNDDIPIGEQTVAQVTNAIHGLFW